MASLQGNPIRGELSSNDRNAFIRMVDKDLEWFESAIKRYHEKKKEQLSLTPDGDEFSRLLKQEIEDEMLEVVRASFGKYLVSDPLRKERMNTEDPKDLREFWVQLDFEKDFAPVYTDCLNSALQTIQNRLISEKHRYTEQEEDIATASQDDAVLHTPTSSVKKKKRKNSDVGTGTHGKGRAEKRVSFSPTPQFHKGTGLPYVDV